MALIGTLLRQKGQSRVVRASGSFDLCRAINALTGLTTKKKTTAPTMRKVITALIKPPTRSLLPMIGIGTVRVERPLGPLPGMRGVMMPLTKALTTAVKAAPMTIPTARSTTLPRKMNFSKSFN